MSTEDVEVKDAPAVTDETTTTNNDNNNSNNATENVEIEDATKEKVDVDLVKVCKQLEFYFSDSNFPRDKFLKGVAREHKGWVPLAVLATFKNLVTLGANEPVIAEATKLSTEFLELNETGDKIRRVPPLDGDAWKKVKQRSLYCKNLPQDATIQSIHEFFNKLVDAPVRSVRLSRDRETKVFRRRAYIEFETAEQMNSVVVMNGALKWDDNVLDMEGATDRMDRKKLDHATSKKRKRDDSASDKKEDDSKQSDEQVITTTTATTTTSATDTIITPDGDVIPANTTTKADDNTGPALKKQKNEKLYTDYERKLLVEVGGIGSGAEHTEVRNALQNEGFKVKFVQKASRDADTAIVRFPNGSKTDVIIEQLIKSQVKINDCLPTYTILDGEREQSFWQSAMATTEKARNNRRGGRGGGGRRGGRGRGGRGRRRR